MTTSLASQLSRLATPQTSIFAHTRLSKSILFEPSEAAKYGRDFYFDIGWSGYTELVQINNQFGQFEEELFSRKCKDLQRAVQDAEANTKLDKVLDKFLLLLSPYLEKQASLKALEWLIHRFLVHEMNKKSLFMCIFPYYETSLFIRILQVMDVSEEAGLWHWLHPIQKAGRPLPKETVFTAWGHNQGFRAFLANYLRQTLEIQNKESNLKIAASFYFTTVVGGLSLLDKVKEKHLTHIVNLLPLCLKSSRVEVVAGAYLVLAHLAIKTRLTHLLLDKIFTHMVEVNTPLESLKEQCVLCLVALTHHQQVEQLSEGVVRALHHHPFIMTHLQALASTKSVATFCSAYITGTISWLVQNSDKLEDTERSQKLEQLLQHLAEIPMSSADAAKVIWSVFESVRKHREALEVVKGLELGEVVAALEASHPEGHRRALTRLISLANTPGTDKDDYRLVMKLLLTHKSSSTNFIQLVHPDDTVRLAAAENFIERVSQNQEKDEAGIKMHLKNLLSDENPEVVLRALTFTQGLSMLDLPFLVKQCQGLIVRAEAEGARWVKVKVACFRVLYVRLAGRYDADTLNRVLYSSLPYVLFSDTKVAVKATQIILGSKMSSKLKFLSSMKEKLGPYVESKTHSGKGFLHRVWKVLPQVLGSMSEQEYQDMMRHLQGQLGASDNLLPHFMSLVFLYCDLENDKKDQLLRLRTAHRLLDACLLSFDTCKVLLDKGSVVEQVEEQQLDQFVGRVLEGGLPATFLSQAVVRALRVFHLPDVCVNNPFWTPSMETGGGEGNLALLLKSMRAAVQLERLGGQTAEVLRNNVAAAVLKKCLETPRRQLYLLALVWGWHPSLSPQGIVDPALQVWTLKLGVTLLSSYSGSLAWALGCREPLVPALVSALTSESGAVREAAVECMQVLANVEGGRLTQDNYGHLLETLTTHSQEVVADTSQIPSLLVGLRTTHKGRAAQVRQVVVGVVVGGQAPYHLKAALLYALSSTSDQALLQSLLPLASTLLTEAQGLGKDGKLGVAASLCLYYVLLQLSPETSGVLETEAGWTLFHGCLTCCWPVLDLPDQSASPQSVLMTQVMSQPFFSSLKSDQVQCRLWSVLIDRVVESQDAGEASRLRKGLRKVTLDAAVVAKQVEELNLVEKAVTTIRAAQAKRIKQREEEKTGPQLTPWRKLGLMLETIGEMAGLGRPWLLVAPLCRCLQRSLTLNSLHADLAQQQILSALLHLLQQSSAQLGDEVGKSVQLNVELLVQCIRASVSPDTHRRALLVLAFAAKIYPEAVMHNMVSIFTFMGTSLLRRDDSYSFQVIHQTIQTVIPTLIQSESVEQLPVKLAQVCQVFVDALPDVPEHRRLPLFIQLANTVHVSTHLWVILALLADSHVMKEHMGGGETGAHGEERGAVPKLITFTLTFCSQFPVPDQVFAAAQLIKYINTLPEEKEELCHQSRSTKKQKKTSTGIISWDVHSPRQVCYFKYTCTALIAQLLASDKFVGQVVEASKGEEGRLQQLYTELLEATMCYLRSVSQACDRHKDKPGGRLLVSLQRKVVDVVDGVNAVLPPKLFLRVTSGLLTSPLALVRCRAMEILCAKIHPSANFFSEKHMKGVSEFVAVLCQAAGSAGEPADNQQTALFTLQLLTRFLTPHVAPPSLQPVLATAVAVMTKKDADIKLVTQALLVVSEAVVALKAHAITHLNQLLPTVLTLLRSNRDSDQLLLATVTALQKVVESLPQLLSPYLESLVCELCLLHAGRELSAAAGRESKLGLRLTSVNDTVVRQVEARVLLPSLSRAYSGLVEREVGALENFMALVEQLVSHVEATTLTQHKPQLLTLFTQALDLRTQKGDLEVISRVEDRVNQALSKMLMRLNEQQNVAIFSSLHRWAVDHPDKPLRLITFYRFADHLAGRFQVLFIKAKLADQLFSHAASLLDSNNTLHQQHTVYGSGTEAERRTCELLGAVLDSLTKVFLYDSVSFTTQERFQLMVKPLTDQLENMVGGEAAFEERVNSHLIPCLTKFTMAVGDDSLWKDLNRQILQRVRNDDQPKVILAALGAFRALLEALGEDYVQPLLADTMPYMTEVLESLNPEVEATTKEIFTKMEAILGDNLRAYLDY